MKIELLDDRTVKVILSNPDMLELQLNYEDMDYTNISTRKAILKLLDIIKVKTELDFSHERLFIEAFPYADGGCILYVNSVKGIPAEKKHRCVTKAQSFDTPLILSFENLEPLVTASKRLFISYSHIILKSDLFLMKNKYYISLYTYFKMDKDILQLALEYGNFYGKGAIFSAIIHEHAKLLISQNAISTLTKYLA